MQMADYVVLLVYFLVLIAIGFWSARRVRTQDDFFIGGRSFGKLTQIFAAFGAGTGSNDPVPIVRTTFASGMSGTWSVMTWLWVTPFYWIAGVWYRRMRHLTLGDWFVERYESRAMGAAYCVFGLIFFMVYGSMMFSAIGVVAAPLVGVRSMELNGQQYGIEYLLVPIMGAVVLAYGVAGGLRAAYFTDLLQGLCIILLSVLLIPIGLEKLVERFGNSDTDGLLAGCRILHEQLPDSYFSIASSNVASEFPLQRIVAVVIISLVGVVVQPQFITTGGGSARTEFNARVGVVAGNFLKFFCTIGWALTALIVLALFADTVELSNNPQETWGVALRELLGPGLTGLMLACLLAAIMNLADTYMIVGSALVVRNIYAPYFKPNASEREYVLIGRITSSLVIVGAVTISLAKMDVYAQLKWTWVFPVLFAAPFWIGMYWRRATTAAAWCSIAFCALMFFLIPFLTPLAFPHLREDPRFLTTTRIVQTTSHRPVAPSDIRRRQQQMAQWNLTQAAAKRIEDPVTRSQKLTTLGPRPTALAFGDSVETQFMRGGASVFWGDGVRPVDAQGNLLRGLSLQPIGAPVERQGNEEVVLGYDRNVRLRGFGSFRLDFLLYKLMGIDLGNLSDATLGTLELFPKIILPFLVMISLCLVTRRNSEHALDRYYAKMKTPVVPDCDQDARNLASACADPTALDYKRLFPGTDFEFQKPTALDVVGFVLCLCVCFAILGVAVVAANLGT